MAETPGRLHVEFSLLEREPYWVRFVNDESGKTIARFDARDDPMPDARRMVACWNACDGIGTEYLETTTSLREADIAHKTELLERVSDLEAGLRNCIDGHEHYPSCLVCAKARALLEKKP